MEFLRLFTYFLHCFAELEEEQRCGGRNGDNVCHGFCQINGENLVFKEVGQNVDERYKQNQLAENCQEYRGLCVADADKGLLAGGLYAENDKARAVNTHSPCGKVAQLNVACEQRSDAAGEENYNYPYADGENKADYQQQAERVFDSLSIFTAEVVADYRLGTLSKTHENEECAVHNGGKNGHRADGGVAAVFQQGGVESDVQQAFRGLHDKGRKTERDAGKHQLEVGREINGAQAENGFLAAEEKYYPHGGYCLGNNGSQSRALYTHAEAVDKDGIEDYVANRADYNGEHTDFCKALRGYKGIQTKCEGNKN